MYSQRFQVCSFDGQPRLLVPSGKLQIISWLKFQQELLACQRLEFRSLVLYLVHVASFPFQAKALPVADFGGGGRLGAKRQMSFVLN
jgi:hypothetical protein